MKSLNALVTQRPCTQRLMPSAYVYRTGEAPTTAASCSARRGLTHLVLHLACANLADFAFAGSGQPMLPRISTPRIEIKHTARVFASDPMLSLVAMHTGRRTDAPTPNGTKQISRVNITRCPPPPSPSHPERASHTHTHTQTHTESAARRRLPSRHRRRTCHAATASCVFSPKCPVTGPSYSLEVPWAPRVLATRPKCSCKQLTSVPKLPKARSRST